MKPCCGITGAVLQFANLIWEVYRLNFARSIQGEVVECFSWDQGLNFVGFSFLVKDVPILGLVDILLVQSKKCFISSLFSQLYFKIAEFEWHKTNYTCYNDLDDFLFQKSLVHNNIFILLEYS